MRMSSAVASQMRIKDVNRLYKHVWINIELNKAMSQICSNTAGVLPTYRELATNKLKQMRKDAVFWSDHVIYPLKCLTIKLLCVKTRSEITNKYRTPLGEDGQLTMIRLIFFFFCTYVRGHLNSYPELTKLIVLQWREKIGDDTTDLFLCVAI